MPDKPGTGWHMHKTRAPSVGKTSRSRWKFEDGELMRLSITELQLLRQASQRLGS